MATPISATATVVSVNTSGTKSLTLPSAASRLGRIITIKDINGTASTNNITIYPYADGNPAGTTQAVDLIEGRARTNGVVNPLSVNVNFGAVTLISVVTVEAAINTGGGNNTTGYGWRILSSTYLNAVNTATITTLTVSGSETINTGAYLTLQTGTYLNIQGTSIISTSGDIYAGTGVRISANQNLAVLPNLSANLVSIGQAFIGSLAGINQTETGGLSTNYMSVGQAFIANLVTANEFITTSFSTTLMSVGQAYLASTTTGFLTVGGQMSTLSNVGIGGQLSVTNIASFNSNIILAANASFTQTGTGTITTGAHTIGGGSNLTLSGAGKVEIQGTANTLTLSNSGNTQLGTDIYFTGTSNLARVANISVNYISAGQAYLGNLNTSTLSALFISTTSNVGIGGQLSVTAATTLNSTLTVVGQMSTLSTLGVGGLLSVTGPTIMNSNLTVQAVGGASLITVNTLVGAISIGGSAGNLTTAGGSFQALTGTNQFGSNLVLTGSNGADYARLANTSTNLISSGNITVGNTMNAFIASTQQNIASSFFGNLADAQTVVVQSV